MTALAWDQLGDHRYESGLDRGVLYLQSGLAVPWNGLTGLTENRSREIKSFYTDGIKYLDHHIPGEFSANLTAFTYPDELNNLLGDAEYISGVTLYDQNPQPFHLSYRTKIGNDLDTDAGYNVHILWNLLAVPADVQFTSQGAQADPISFSWTLTSTPSQMLGVRPSSHVSLNSLRVSSEVLSEIEALLYGTESANPALPTLSDLLLLLPDEAVGL